MNDSLIVNGRKYIPLKKAAEIAHYDPQSLNYWRRKGVLGFLRGKGRIIYICLSDLYAWIEQNRAKRTKWQQITEWWLSHTQERTTIQDTYHFHRLLRRDGIECSPALARWWYATYVPRPSKTHQVLAWLEADPSRRHLSESQALRQLRSARKTNISANALKRAWKHFDEKHGPHRPPFDESQFLSTKQAAERYGVSRSLITQVAAKEKFTCQHWHDTLYILRSDLERRFGHQNQED